MTKKVFFRFAGWLLMLALGSCGGGGGGGTGGVSLGSPSTALVGTVDGTIANDQVAGIAGARPLGAAGNSGDTSSGVSSAVGGDTPGTGTGTSAPGSTGTTASAAGGDDSGVGSGGTGVSTADAVSVGSVDGLGSIIVNGLRYNTDGSIVRVEDAPALLIGMSVKVTGPVDPDFTNGVARVVESAAELRGPVSAIDLAAGTFMVQGTSVTTDSATVWGDVVGLSDIGSGSTLQVWGLPSAAGSVRATRVERRSAGSLPIVTGAVQALDSARQVFRIGALTVDFGSALQAGAVDAGSLVDGVVVRVRSTAPVQAGVLSASRVQFWNPIPRANGLKSQVAGVVTNYSTLQSLQVLGVPVDARQANITGGPASSIGSGVKVEVDGTFANGTLIATKLRIKQVPGTGGPSSFNVIGNIGNFTSSASFRVRGQPVDASGTGVTFVGGSPASLGNGARVNVVGSQIRDGVLLADRVSFE